jgi:hypothetical protein
MEEDADAEASAHERAAELQERLGYADRAANARQHAEHARDLHEQALAEQTALETEPARGVGGVLADWRRVAAGRPPAGSRWPCRPRPRSPT